MRALAAPILRIGLGLVFLWFGVSQLIDPAAFFGYVPGFAARMAPDVALLVRLNGTLDLLLGISLVTGLFVRIAAWVGAVHLLAITTTLGFNEIGVRDFGLASALVAIALNGPDEYSLERRLRKKA